MKKILLYITVFIFNVAIINAQDIHFTNYNAQPLVLNPAMTGMNGCDWRVGANFRTQWLGVSEGNTYRTVSAFADIAVGKPTKYSNFGGVGLSFFSDQAGDLNYNTNRVDLSFAYHFIINKKQSISAGIQGAFIHRSFNQSKALYEFDPITGEPVLAAAESFDASTKMYGDANLGFLYSIEPKKNTNYYIGIALHHLNQPNISSFNINRDKTERLYMKFTLHGGALIPMGKQLGIMPGFMFLKQGPTFEANLSTYFKYRFSQVPNNKNAIYFGAGYRVLDAVFLGARADLGGFQIHFSYDLNVSKLTGASKANGGPEVAVIYTGCLNRKNSQRYCPNF